MLQDVEIVLRLHWYERLFSGQAEDLGSQAGVSMPGLPQYDKVGVVATTKRCTCGGFR